MTSTASNSSSNCSRAKYSPSRPSDPSSQRRACTLFPLEQTRDSKVLDDSAVWTIALNLLSSANRRRGTLTVHRLYSPRDLQLDINLLTSAFPMALADALDRTLAHSAQVIALPEKDPALLAAQAG